MGQTEVDAFVDISLNNSAVGRQDLPKDHTYCHTVLKELTTLAFSISTQFLGC